MNDTIYRQAAIDEIVAWLKDRMTDKKNGKPLTDRIKYLPSAQPTDADIQKMQDIEQAELEKAFELGREDAKQEVIRCKDCVYHAGWNYCEEVDGLWYDDDYCCHGEKGERREE